ncbi:MAG TPA: type II secretion system protein GspG [Longimicrobium sp.]|nr:type II secretion system protein GspG [Longimicrobium sp.]
MIAKLFWALVLAVAVVVLVPPVREKVWPKLQPALNPVYEWNAKTEVNEIKGLVKRADALGRTVPSGEGFSAFVNQEAMQQDASTDPWGTPFYIVFNGNQFQVGSAGKDRQAGTTDDILSNPEPVTHVPDRRR